MILFLLIYIKNIMLENINLKYHSHLNYWIDFLKKIYNNGFIDQPSVKNHLIIIPSGKTNFQLRFDGPGSFNISTLLANFLPINKENLFLVIDEESIKKNKLLIKYIDRDGVYDPFLNFHSDEDKFWSQYFTFQKITKFEEVVGDKDFVYLSEQTFDENNVHPKNNKELSQKIIHYFYAHRLYKTDYEIALMHRANQITLEYLEKTMNDLRNIKDLSEISEIDVFLMFNKYAKLPEGVFGLSYPPVCCINEHAAILHNRYTTKKFRKEDNLFLIDIGINLSNYCSDITRTYNLGVKHKTMLKIMESLEQIKLDTIAMAKPGIFNKDLYMYSAKKIIKVLVENKIIYDNEENVLKNGSYRIFFPHNIGHQLGSAVHDTQNVYFENNKLVSCSEPRNPKLQERMIITVEPGIYFNPMLIDRAYNFYGKNYFNVELIAELIKYGGIRSEDNVLITKDGHINITANKNYSL